MTAENFDRVFGILIRRQPFHPFTVELIGGEQFEVDHAHALVLRDGVAVFVRPGGIPVLFDHESVLQVISDIADSTK